MDFFEKKKIIIGRIKRGLTKKKRMPVIMYQNTLNKDDDGVEMHKYKGIVYLIKIYPPAEKFHSTYSVTYKIIEE